MKTVRNKTRKPLKIQLHGGKVLHIGPLKSGQISDEAAEEPGVKRHLEAGEIEILGEGAHAVSADEGHGAASEATHGHPQTTVVLPKGNR